MIDCDAFYRQLLANGIAHFVGVPDSLLKDLCACITNHSSAAGHVIAANEGAAIGLAAGYHLATGQASMVYMQNSGLGNTVNPLTSLADPEVYSIPLLLCIGWRGEPEVHDEPQHVKMGKVTLPLLKTLGIPFEILPDNLADAEASLQRALHSMRTRRAPYALVVRKGTFAPCKLKREPAPEPPLSREAAIAQILQTLGDRAVIVSTTGMASREVFELREKSGTGHHLDFLTVGSMGHASQIALGVAQWRQGLAVYCLDGDGALLMHLGALPIIGSLQPRNFKHIVLNNGAHDSVGGQPTAALAIRIPEIARACGYKSARSVEDPAALTEALRELQACDGPALLEVRVRKGARSDLGRPTTNPVENKQDFMNFLAAAPPPAGSAAT